VKLYLSSYRIPTPGDLENLLDKSFKDCRTVIISNAKDYNPPAESAQKINELNAYMANLGFSADIADLRDYDDSQRLLEDLTVYDLIWVAGGNTYVLRREMQRSGFDLVVRDLIGGGCIYGGESAGAIVAGASLQGFEVADDSSLTDETIWEGLSLTDKIIAPHMDSPDLYEYTEHIKKFYAGDERIVYLDNNQALVVNRGSQSIVTGSDRNEG